MPRPAKAEELRRRPDVVRYFFMAVTPVNLHTGLSWHGLNYVRRNYEVTQLYLADLDTGVVTKVTEGIDDFMELWRTYYNDPAWEYKPGGETGGESVSNED